MSSFQVNEPSVIKIFNEMMYKEEAESSKSQLKDSGDDVDTKKESLSELKKVLKISKKSREFHKSIEAAINAQIKCESLSPSQRIQALHEISSLLKNITNNLQESKNDFLILADYFDYYSDLTAQAVNYFQLKPQKVVLVVLPKEYSPFFILGAIVPPALALGCSVIVLTSQKSESISLFLEEIINIAGLPEGIFSVVNETELSQITKTEKIQKVFFCGSFLEAQKLYQKSLAESFSFFCPNNTSALILESSDLNAAADKIVTETWAENSLFGVSNVVVQESIQKCFLEKLKYRIKQFMIENKNSPKFKDEIIAQKIFELTEKASLAGASIEKLETSDNVWSPTIIVSYQNQHIEEDAPVLKVLLCRSAKEGVALINNCPYNHGTSIWSEISSQALEISSLLICPNVWINCHGVFQAGEPFQLTELSGDGVLGGSDGLLEYASTTHSFPNFVHSESISTEDKNFSLDKQQLLKTAASAHKAFSSWKLNSNRRNYFKNLATSLENNKIPQKIPCIISNIAHFGYNTISFERNMNEEFSVFKKKVPVGVILLFVNTSTIDSEKLTTLIATPLVCGNAVIVVLKENSSAQALIKNFINFLPKNLLSMIIGIKAGEYLASDPNIKAIWYCISDQCNMSSEFLKVKTYSKRSLKHIWVVSENTECSQYILQKQCLQNKIVWLTKVDSLK